MNSQKPKFINILDNTPRSTMLAFFIKASIQTDKSGKLQKHTEFADVTIKDKSDLSAEAWEDLWRIYGKCIQTITQQNLGQEANYNLILLLNEHGVEYELTSIKAANDDN